MTAAVAAIAQAAHTDLAAPIFAAVSAGETGRVPQACFARSGPPDYAIVCIGTDGKVAAGNKGRIDVMSPSAGNPFTPACRGTASTQSTVRGGVS